MFNHRYQYTKHYLQNRKKDFNLNLEVWDIEGTIPMGFKNRQVHKFKKALIHKEDKI